MSEQPDGQADPPRHFPHLGHAPEGPTVSAWGNTAYAAGVLAWLRIDAQYDGIDAETANGERE